jgi:hypothetical protein
MARTTVPRITWGAAFANQLDIGFPMDNATSWSQPREGSETAKSPGGVEDAWTVGTDEYLAGLIRWITTADITSPVVASGWDATDGWKDFLEWARDKNQFRWIPDKDTPGTYILSYLVEPMEGEPDLESNGDRRLRLVMRNGDGNAYTGY